jgi:hypothetical protein
MAKRGRPIQGAALVQPLAGSAQAKERLQVILQTLAGQLTIDEACTRLALRRSAFNKLRAQFLAGATGLLEPKRSGRKKHVASPAELEAEQLRAEVARLKLELQAQQIREEIALVLPRLQRPRRWLAKKNVRRDGPRGTFGGSSGSVRK